MVQHLQIVPVEAGCVAYTNLYTLYGKTEINVEQNFIYLPQPVSFTQSTFDPVNLGSIYQELSQLNLPSEIHFRELELWEKTNSWRKHSLSVGGFLLLMAFLLGLAIVGYLLWTYFKFRRATRSAAPAPAPEVIELLNR